MKMIDDRILVLGLEFQAAEYKLKIQKSFFNPNLLCHHLCF